MPIVEDYAAIAAELRKLRSEKRPAPDTTEAPAEPMPQHRMRATIAGDLLYRRLVSQRVRGGIKVPLRQPHRAERI
jgi:hypothetical protein